ncbi:hypothetical protein FACS1894151_06800 [Spirochaetia bacterium]|nr:hypothetical protein FACS1894151_06800 [Spirochaetia bacterium]
MLNSYNILIISLFIFWGAVSVTHLVSQYFRDSLIRKITKGFLIPPLLVLYCLYAAENSHPVLAVIAAAVFGWIGDVLLIKITEKKYFLFGLAAFLLGHVCYVIAMTGKITVLNSTALIISIAASIPLGIITFILIRPDKAMRIPVLLYEMVIITMSISALQLLFLYPRGAVIFTGSVFFLVSDLSLAWGTFRGFPKWGNFLVMATYIIGQALILLGMAGI